MLASYFRFILRHRVVVAILCTVITAAAVLAISRARMASSLGELVLGDSPGYREYVEWTGRFGSDERLIVAIPTDQLRDEAGADRLRSIVDAIGELDVVARTESALSFRDLRGRAMGLSAFADNQPLRTQGPIDFDALAADPIAGGTLVSADGAWTIVTVTIAPEGQAMTLERAPQAVEQVAAIFIDHGIERADLHFGGLVRALAEVQNQTKSNLGRIMPLVGALMLISTFLLFRRLWPVVITFLVGLIAIIWTLGFSLLLDRQINMLVALSPALILLISFADVVHLYAAWEQACRRGGSSRDALMQSATDVGRACLYTSVTTFVGFVGIALINVPAFRHLGLVLGFGVSIALLLAMTLTPIVLSMISPPRLRPERRSTWLDRRVTGLRRIAVGHPWLIIGASAVVLLLSVVGVTRITVETDITVRFPESSEFRQDLAFIGERFGGTHTVEVYVEPDASIDDLTLARQSIDFHRAVEAIDGVARVMSPAMISALVSDEHAVPLLSVALSPTDESIAPEFIASDGTLRFVAILEEHGMVNALQVGRSIEDLGGETFGAAANVTPSGLSYLAGHWLRSHLAAQRVAVLVSLGVVALMMIIVLRSIRLGLWSMLPNLFPLIVLGGLLGFGWGIVDSDAVILVLVVMGIAVDDTIHFLTRARIESIRTPDRDEALQSTFDFAGRAIVMTSLIFAAGFLPFALADYTTIRMLGLLLPIVMIVALLADLLLLPALMTVGLVPLPRYRDTT